MNAQRYLETVGDCDRRVRHHLAHQAWLMEQLQQLGDEPRTQQTRAMWLLRSEMLTREIEDGYAALDAQTRKVRHLIDRLPDMDERSALTLRFVDLLPHERAAETMHISVRHLYRIQRRALMHLEGIIR